MFTANTQNLLNQAANASLVAAADGGNAEAVAKAISEGADLRYLDQKSNQTALHAAAKAGSVPCVQVLLRANADVNAVNGVNATPLIYAAQKGHLDVVQALLAGGAKHDIVTRVRASPTGRAITTAVRHRRRCSRDSLTTRSACASPRCASLRATRRRGRRRWCSRRRRATPE